MASESADPSASAGTTSIVAGASGASSLEETGRPAGDRGQPYVAQAYATGEPEGDSERDGHGEPPDDAPPQGSWPTLPPIVPSAAGTRIADLTPAACMERITALRLPFERAPHEAVDAGVIPTGRVGGVAIRFTGRRRQGRIIDCRLLLALHHWAPLLRAIGVIRIRHLSGLRPGAVVRTTGRPSGHARGFAFDPRFFDFADGRTFDVLNDWDDRVRGAPLCEEKQENRQTALVRAAVCAAIRGQLFQVVVSPHHNDDHQNHLHLEVVPGVTWSWSGKGT